MALPEHAIQVYRRSDNRLVASHIVKENGSIKSRAYLGDSTESVIVYLPPEVHVGSGVLIGGTLELYTRRYAKQPEICISDEKGTRCNLHLNPADLFDISAHKRVFEAYKELVTERPELEGYFRSIVRRVVISKGEHKPGVEAVTKGYADGTCEIVLYDDVIFGKDLPEIKRVLVHELGHCIENYARKRKYIGELKGEWKNGTPVGSERRAEKFAKRVVGYSPFL